MSSDEEMRRMRFEAACAAMLGLYASWKLTEEENVLTTPEAMKFFADIAVKQADALLERLNDAAR